MKSFINLTPHAVNVLDDDDNTIVTFLPSSDYETARVPMVTTELGYAEVCVVGVRLEDIGEMNSPNAQVPLIDIVFGMVENLPPSQPDTLFIVSALVQSHCPGRQDLVVPSPSVRDEDGNIIGCRGFAFHTRVFGDDVPVPVKTLVVAD